MPFIKSFSSWLRLRYIALWISVVFFSFQGSVVLSQPLKRLSHVCYNVNEGLLQSQVYDITEDGNGFIWISSGGGVQRFDGRKFHHIPVTTGSNGIPNDRYVWFTRLKNGNLWLNHGNGVSEYDIISNRFRTIKEIKPGLTTGHYAFAEEDQGTWLWICKKGFYKLDKATNRFSDSISSGFQKLFSVSSGIPILNNGYFVQFDRWAMLITDRRSGEAKLLPSPTGKPHFFATEKYFADTVLVATARGIEKLDCQTGTFVLLHPYKTNPGLVNLLHPVQLKLVSATTCLVSEANMLFELDLQQGNYTSQLINLQNQPFTEVGYITGFFHDSHSNLWIISENEGIKKVNYRFEGFRYFGTPDRKSNFVKSLHVEKKDNRVLCGTFGAGLLVFDSTRHLLKEIRHFPGIQGPVTICGFIRIAPHRYLLLAMATWTIYLLNTENFSLQKINTIPGHHRVLEDHFPDYHLSIFPLNDSTSILQTGFRVNKLVWQAPGKVTIYNLDTFSVASVSSRLLHDKLWVGSYGRFYISEPGFTSFREIVLPENKLVRCFAENEKNQVWMGTEKGLYLLDGSGTTLKLIGKKDGLPDENVYAIRTDKRNNLWLSHNKGISCRKTDGSFLHFSKNDGLQENEFNTNTSFETPDGELFFGGVNGISSFYPESVSGVMETPRLLITRIQIKDGNWNGDTTYWNIRRIVLPYYSDHITIELAAIGNRTPDQYNYQYQVKGQDAGWVNAGNDPQVRFSLNPGNYVFRYYAGNSFEKDPAHVKELIIIIRPPFWKTGWFITGLILVVAVSIIFTTRYISQVKLKKKIDELERKKVLYEERLRISREMHDDIGAGLTQITLMSEKAKHAAMHEEPLNEIAGVSRKLVGSMNEIIWSLNPENNTLEQLLAYLREQLNSLLEYSGITYEIKFPENGSHIILNNAQRRNLLLVSKEIVHNAIKHSGAGNISVECKVSEGQLWFMIIDDGKGFDTLAKSKGHGLRNIRRRIEELNGTLHILSADSDGSRFSYTIPLS